MERDSAEFKRIVHAYYLNQFKIIIKNDKLFPHMNKNISEVKKIQAICNTHLKRLDKELTNLMKLRYVNKLNQDELVAMTGLSTSTIYRKINKVTRLLKLDLILNKII